MTLCFTNDIWWKNKMWKWVEEIHTVCVSTILMAIFQIVFVLPWALVKLQCLMQISRVVFQMSLPFLNQMDDLLDNHEHIASGLLEPKNTTLLPHHQPIRELCASWSQTLWPTPHPNLPFKTTLPKSFGELKAFQDMSHLVSLHDLAMNLFILPTDISVCLA